MQVRQLCGRSELEPSTNLGPQMAMPMSLVVTSRTSGVGGALLNLEGRSLLGTSVHPPTVTPGPKAPNMLHYQLGNFLASVVRSRTFYGTLADTICEDYPDRSCWNGERVGE